MEYNEELNVEFIEKEIVNVDLVEKEIVNVELTQVDLIPRKTYITELDDTDITDPQDDDVLTYEDGYWVNRPLPESKLVPNETPSLVSPLPSKRFQTANSFVAGSLQVFLNGQKIHSSEITTISTTQFEFPIDIIATDKVEVNYTKSN